MSDRDNHNSEDITNSGEYRVLARKYRPADFDTLIGQDAMVKTLSNAIDTGRLAHAFILTGVRGVGKTTTARIIAKGLNCITAGGPTVSPCGTCENCTSISESRHVDVLEMDAASRTGVDDIREIIESVRYAPVSARFKIYIIDEVHMLSKNAFNALLKTLEEPPAHVKFIFATTEIRKLPVTVLSRCQRFDLKRVEADVLVKHLSGITKSENCEAEDPALKLIARAAEGSVRDSLSLLDQAIAHGAGKVDENQVRDMLGLADRAQVLDLFEALMKGDIAGALATLRAQYDRGADPAVILNDLLEVAHWLTRLKVTPDTGTDALVSEAERTQGGEMAKALAMPVLTRAWQMLLKGLGEVRVAPSPISAAEMVLIRLAYSANLPNPADLVKQIKDGNAKASADSSASLSRTPVSGHATTSLSTNQGQAARQENATRGVQTSQVLAFNQNEGAATPKHPLPITFEKMIDLFTAEKRGQIATALKDRVRVVDYTPGKMTLNIDSGLPNTFLMDVKVCLKEWTGQDWLISLARSGGGETVQEKEKVAIKQRRSEAMDVPIVKALYDLYPDVKLIVVRDDHPTGTGIGDGALPTDPSDGVSDMDDSDDIKDFDF